MWSQLFLCALIGFAAASRNGWQSNMEYQYQVRGRTLTALHDVANQYSGIVMKAKLIVRPESDESLMAKIVNAQYSQLHANLPEGWKSDLSEHQLQYKQLELSEEPFQILLKNGIVRDVIVGRQVHNWEANIIKAIVSQVQLDTQGENVIKAHVNQLPEGDDNSAVFKTMEDTITGTYETLYDITPLPEYILQSQPELVPMPELQKDGEIIEIVKTKNFSRSEERLGYYYGLGGMGQFEPTTNQMGDFFLRSALSRVIVTGSLKRYTIQSATTTNKIILSPTLNNAEQGMVVSHLNLTLADVKPSSGSFQQPQQGQKLGSLTYTFNTPFSGNHEARQGAKRQQQEYMFSSEEDEGRQSTGHYRHPRSVQQSTESVESNEEWAQEEAKLNQPPQSPLLPLFIGYKGKSIKYADKINVVEVAQKLAQQIGKEIQHPEEIQKEHTLAKFVILRSVAAIMSDKEMQQVADKLQTSEQWGPKVAAWIAYRDAIAECGTGPALLTIQEWIKTKKIEHEEAAEVIATMADAVRQPTEEYMRTFFTLATQEEHVQRQYLLNDTAILSFARLARKVYVDKLVSHNEYPVHAFGKFRTEEGQKIVVDQLIPYLKEQLTHAIREGDSHKTLVYIRCLGNVAHPQILEVFEPYLEGQKPCSQFQRLQMVVALDKLVQVHPKIARSVLYKIYQNAGEMQEIRVAAVYQLMRTAPPASMLQRMAQYTNVDTDEQVNAAVKSAIETASQLEGEETYDFASNARAAQPLLTKKTYGLQYSSNFLRSYVISEMNLFYKQTVHTYGSQDSFVPKGIKYALRANLGGTRREIVNVETMVSSIDELTNVIYRQCHQYAKQQEQQQQGYQQAKQQKWSAEYIAEKLNMKNPEREQLEGNFLVQLAGGVTRYFTLNNQTIEMLPQVLREVEDMLREGKEFQYTKFMNRYDIDISFPTEMALPFIYTLDAPTLLHIQGKIRATSEPKMSNGEVIRMPETITAHAEVRAVVSSKMQAKLGFVTPFDHQQYVAGYDKNVQINLPLKSQYEIDLKNKNIHAQFQPLEQEKNTQVLHYSTWPYTAKHNILQLEPIANGQHTKVIYAQEQPATQINEVFGKETGMAFRVEYVSEQKFADAMWFYEQFQRHDAISALLAPVYDETIQHTKLNVEYDAEKSSARKIQVRFGYEHLYEQEQGQNSVEISQFAELPRQTQQRQRQFAKMVSSGIASSTAHVVDVAVEFDGNKQVEYVATAAIATSPVDPTARVLFHCKKHSATGKSYEVAVSAKTHIPNTNGLDYEYALRFDPTTTAQAEIAFGDDLRSATKLHLHAKLHKSEERTQYLKHSERAQECQDELKHGNQQLPACANMTAEANLMDRVQLRVEFDHLSAKARNVTYKLYNAVRYLGYFNLDENTVDPQTSEKDGEMTLLARFEPDFESFNLTVRTHKMESHIDSIRVNQWGKQVLAIHPVFPMYTRMMGQALDYDTYRPICVVDASAANTFDNKTYPLDLGNDWTVMMQYVPQFARDSRHHQKYLQQQEELQLEQYSVLVRDEKNGNEKEVKMTIRTPESEGQMIVVELKPQSQQCGDNKPCAKVIVNGNEIHYDDKKTHEVKEGLVKIYALPNGEVKIEVRSAFYIIYDGERVKLTATHDKLRDAVRGLCGTFTGEETDDFLAPENCIYQHPEHFVAAYQVEQSASQSRPGRYSYKSAKGQHECVEQEIQYANVISDQDAGRKHQQYHQRYSHSSSGSHQHQQQWQNSHSRHHNEESTCVAHQTRYEVRERDNEICFTIRPLPVCKSHCSADRVIEKSVPVHCVEKSSVSQLWKQQIDNGASPDFSHKATTKTIKMQVQDSCSRY